MATYGYARVSTQDQGLDLQLDALRAAGCGQVFEDKTSGARARRPGLDAMLVAVTAGDTVVVWKLDRLGRSLRNLIELAEELKERGVVLRSITDGIDTSGALGGFLLAILGAVAELERSTIRERMAAGYVAARARQVRVGRKHTLTRHQREQAGHLALDLGKSVSVVAALLRCSRSTAHRAIQAAKAERAGGE